MMRFRSARWCLLLLLACAAPLAAQETTLTTDVLDRFVTAYDAEQEGIAASRTKIAEVNDKQRKFRECRTAFEAAGGMGGRLGGVAARAGIRARCGANNESDFDKEREAILTKVTSDAATGAGFTVPAYTRLKTRLQRIYAAGDRAGLSGAEVEAVDSRKERFAGIFGAGADARAVVQALEALGGTVGGGRMAPGQWTADYAWMYVGQLYSLLWATGAAVVDKPYAPGQWTRWKMESEEEDGDFEMERAFIARTENGDEWWRLKMIRLERERGRVRADTMLLEALFRTADGDAQQIVRMRARMPGEKEANEMLVPQDRSRLMPFAAIGSRPTPESIAGATVGTEQVRVPAGSFTAKRVRFGGPEGRQEWWLADAVPGGVVKFQYTASDGEGESYTTQLTAHGTGAKSETGVP